MLENVGCCVKALRSYICASSIAKSDRLKVLEGQSKSAVAILRIRTLAAFANAFRVRPLNHSGRIAVEATSEGNFLWLIKPK